MTCKFKHSRRVDKFKDHGFSETGCIRYEALAYIDLKYHYSDLLYSLYIVEYYIYIKAIVHKV